MRPEKAGNESIAFASNSWLAIALCLLVFILPLSATTLRAGPWQLDTNLDASAGQQLLGNLSFKPLSAPPDNAWQVSGTGLLLLDKDGNLVPELMLAPDCGGAVGLSSDGQNLSCSSATDLYVQQDGKIEKQGHLSFKPTGFFQSFNTTVDTTGGVANQSAAPQPEASVNGSAPDNASNVSQPSPSTDAGASGTAQIGDWTVPPIWLSALAVLIVVGVTTVYQLRKRY